MKRSNLMAVMALIATVLLIAPSTSMATERSWIIPRTDVGPRTAYLMVNASDKITINWKSGNLNGEPLTLYLWASSYAINWSDNMVESQNFDHTYNSHLYTISWSFYSPPQSAWIKFGSDDVVRVDIPYVQNANNIFNFTIDSYLDIYLMIDSLNESINKLINNSINEINSNITSLRENISNLYERTSYIYADIINLSIYESYDISRLYSIVKDQNESLRQLINESKYNDTNTIELMEYLDDLSMLRNNITEIMSNIKPYNDTQILSEIEKIKQIQPIMEFNNTTVINQTLLNQTLVNQTLLNRTEINPTTYHNTTMIEKDTSMYIISAAIGFVSVSCAFFVEALLNRKKKLQEIQIPEV